MQSFCGGKLNESGRFRTLAFILGMQIFLGTSGRAEAGIITVEQTIDAGDLASALGGSGMDNVSVSLTNGDALQFGLFSGFNRLPKDGIVLSSGRVIDLAGPPSINDDPATDLEVVGTPEFDAYGGSPNPADPPSPRIDNFQQSYDVARLEVTFELGDPAAIAFDFVFGSIEYPNWVSDFTDAFLVFLDGTAPANQITFDSQGIPVQVGKSFSNYIVTDNADTVFGDPHGFIPKLTTRTWELSAGVHTLLFEVGDVNDHILDSAAFISNFRTTTSSLREFESETDVTDDDYLNYLRSLNGGGAPTGSDPTAVTPEPNSILLAGCAVVGLASSRLRRRRASLAGRGASSVGNVADWDSAIIAGSEASYDVDLVRSDFNGRVVHLDSKRLIDVRSGSGPNRR
jgi:hypothetical protein